MRDAEIACLPDTIYTNKDSWDLALKVTREEFVLVTAGKPD